MYVAKDNKLLAKEPGYELIPPGMLRRMGKALRIGVGTALPLLQYPVNGIVLGTANGGMEDCIKFLNQIVDYEEGVLTPGNFVQSTPNAVSAQIGLLSANKGYNITHVHLGLAFENAVIDAIMLLMENPENNYLLGGVDEISSYNYNIDYLAGHYKTEIVSGEELYKVNSSGTIAGEGAAMFLINKNKLNSIACLLGISIIQTEDVAIVEKQLQDFIQKYLPENEKLDLFISGENGDNRIRKFYNASEAVIGKNISIARFKHMSGEYPTASAIAVWLACYIFNKRSIPSHMIKWLTPNSNYKNILIYNNYKGIQHSLILLSNTQV